jgi:uncharacterized protein
MSETGDAYPDTALYQVVTHHPCADGMGARWAAWRAFGNTADYLDGDYGKPMPRIPDGKHVFMIDVSYPKDELIALKERSLSLVVLDHHVSAKKNLEGLDFARFDMDMSGAMMAFYHFFRGQEPPMLIQYIQDRDLWRWHLPYSEEINAAIMSYPLDVGTYDYLHNRLSSVTGRVAMQSEGEAILRMQRKLVEQIASQARIENPVIGGKRYDGVPRVTTPVLQSEVGHELLKRHPDAPFAMTQHLLPSGKTKISLRSEDHREDVSVIARSINEKGGGHRNAAGATV